MSSTRAPRRARLDFAMRRSSQGAAGAQVAVAMTVSFVRLRCSGRISTERPKMDTLFNSSHYRERRPFRQPLPSPSTTLPKACFLVEGGPRLPFSWYLGISHSYHRAYRGGRRLRAEPYGKQTWQAFRSAQLRHLAPGRPLGAPRLRAGTPRFPLRPHNERRPQHPERPGRPFSQRPGGRFAHAPRLPRPLLLRGAPASRRPRAPFPPRAAPKASPPPTASPGPRRPARSRAARRSPSASPRPSSSSSPVPARRSRST